MPAPKFGSLPKSDMYGDGKLSKRINKRKLEPIFLITYLILDFSTTSIDTK